MDELYKILITSICSILASSGFWLYVQKRTEKHTAELNKFCDQADMLRGLGHDRIIDQGLTYIRRGFITASQYENLNDYLYKPYKRLGGNGSADRVMNEVNKLEIRG